MTNIVAGGLTTVREPTIAVILASRSRPLMLAQALAGLARQTRPADRILVSVTGKADLPDELPAHVTTLVGARGLPAQRNAVLDRLAQTPCDVIVCFDDDYVPSRYALARIAAFFAAHPDVVGATGHIIADGINNAGIPHDEAERLVEDYDRAPAPAPAATAPRLLYGCNMAFRARAIDRLRFDERLKLYGWQEDIDFYARLLKRGRIVWTDAFAGVHLGEKKGRISGVRLGYSQVVNPLYLLRKGTMRPGHALPMIAKHLLINHARALRPEPWIDRIGRARGNWIAIGDCLRGRLTPERIENL